MPLDKILSEWNEPVKPEVVNEIIKYMKSMPQEHETLLIQCAEHLEKTRTLGSVLAVVHALNGGEFLLRCMDEEDTDLSKEFASLMAGDDTKNTPSAAPYGGT